MLKNILKLKGAQKLTKKEQKSINGGYIMNEEEPTPCPWMQCRNSFGRCSMFCD
jgi:hypothetical protein